MNPESSKLRQQQQQTEQTAGLQQQETGAREFNTAEEALRFDAGSTQAPERIAERLKQSIAAEPPPRVSWWQRLFGRSSQR